MDIVINKLFPIQAIGPGLCLIHKNRYVAVLEAIPINFALRSANDQERLVKGYASFLNGLNFPVQLFVRSDTLRVDEYLADLKANEENIEAHLRPSLGDYVEFLRESVTVHRLIKRHFYIIVSWLGTDSRNHVGKSGEQLWDEAEQELLRRRDILAQGLMALGIRLNTLDQTMMLRFLYASFGRDEPAKDQPSWD